MSCQTKRPQLKERHGKEGPEVELGLAARGKRNRRALQVDLAGRI